MDFLERDLTAELARCDVNDLVRLFGGPPSANAAARARNKADMSVDGAERQTANAAATADWVAPPPHVVEQPGVTLLQANPPEPQWDANGYRIGPKTAIGVSTLLRAATPTWHALCRAEMPGVLLS